MLPAEDTLLPVGRIIKSYGTEGEVMIAFQEGIADLLKRDEPVWLFYDGLPVPFYITSIQPKGPRKAVVRLEDIDTLADAEEAAGKDIRLDLADYPELSGTDAHTITEDGLTLEDLIGFSLQDQDGHKAGTIGDIQDFSGNICLELTGSGALVPFHDDLIIDIDIEKKTLTMSISEGLL